MKTKPNCELESGCILLWTESTEEEDKSGEKKEEKKITPAEYRRLHG